MNELFKEYTYKLKNKIDELPEEFLNQYVIYTTYFQQYAAGICGVNRNTRLLISKDGNGYPYAAAAYKAAKDNGIKPYSRKGRVTPYGEIGAEEYTRKAITVREALKLGMNSMPVSFEAVL
jgi:hypothetical protein